MLLKSPTYYSFHVNPDHDTQEIHIHKSRYTPPTQKWSHEESSICKKNETKSRMTPPLEIDLGDRSESFFEESETRKIAAELQNNDENVCGICVSHLYYTKQN